MPFTIIRQKERADNGSVDVPYWVSDGTLVPPAELDRNMAIAAVAAQGGIDFDAAPIDFTYERMSHKSAVVRLIFRDTEIVSVGGQQLPDPLPVGSVAFSFSAAPQRSEHIIGSLSTVWRLPTNPSYGPAPDFKGLINVQEWSSLGHRVIAPGFDRIPPPETDSVDWAIPSGSFTAAFRKKITDSLFTVHGASTTFFGRPAGETMLVRAAARQRTKEDVVLSFGFAHKPNGHRQFGDINTADISGATPPDGHDYLWAVIFTHTIDAAPGIKIEAPYARWLYNERIWERSDLNELGIPGSSV